MQRLKSLHCPPLSFPGALSPPALCGAGNVPVALEFRALFLSVVLRSGGWQHCFLSCCPFEPPSALGYMAEVVL